MSAKTQDALDREAVERLALWWEDRLAWQERYLASAESGAAEPPEVEQARKRVTEARLIADALRFRLAALSTPPEYFDIVDREGEPVFTGPAATRFFDPDYRERLLARWDTRRPHKSPHRLRLFAEVGAADHTPETE